MPAKMLNGEQTKIAVVYDARAGLDGRGYIVNEQLYLDRSFRDDLAAQGYTHYIYNPGNGIIHTLRREIEKLKEKGGEKYG